MKNITLFICILTLTKVSKSQNSYTLSFPLTNEEWSFNTTYQDANHWTDSIYISNDSGLTQVLVEVRTFESINDSIFLIYNNQKFLYFCKAINFVNPEVKFPIKWATETYPTFRAYSLKSIEEINNHLIYTFCSMTQDCNLQFVYNYLKFDMNENKIIEIRGDGTGKGTITDR